jgi:hypothetical protein
VWDPLDFLEDECVYEDPEESQVNMYLDIFEGALQRCERYNVPVTPLSQELDGRETGDDRVDISPSSSTLAVGLTIQERVFLMRTSEKDTFISDTYWNFCEVSSVIPCGRNESYQHARRTSDFSQLGYSDTAPIRIIVDAQKGDKSHSSTVVGKSSMMGMRVATPRTDLRHKIHLCSYLQDGMLRTYKSPEPKYLPRCLGGSGCPALFDCWENLYYSVHAYRGGGYDRLYGSATNEVMRALDSLEIGRVPELVLTNRLREKEEYFHGTYAEKILVPKPGDYHQKVGTLPPPIIEQGKTQLGLQCVENRLIQARLLIGERRAISELAAKRKLENELLGIRPVVDVELEQQRLSVEQRKRYGNALTANTAFNNLLQRTATPEDVTRLQQEGFLTATSGVTTFSMRMSKWLYNGGRSQTYSIEDLIRTENLYAVEDISAENTMRVSGISLKPYSSSNPKEVRTVSRVGLYEMTETRLEWCEEIYASLREEYEKGGRSPLTYQTQLRVYERNREWINDDQPLIAIIKRDLMQVDKTGKHLILITGDKSLCKKTASELDITVGMLHPRDIVWRLPPQEYSSQFSVTVSELKEKVLNRVYNSYNFLGPYIDYGALAHAAAQYELKPDSESFLKTNVVRVKPISNDIQADGTRKYTYALSDDKPMSKGKLDFFRPKYSSSKRSCEYITRSRPALL